MVARGAWARLKSWAATLLRELQVLAIAVRDPRTPWYAKVVAGLVVAYAFSPIDLIPDPIPVLGYLDDAILLPLGVMLARRLIPSEVLESCRREVASRGDQPRTTSRLGAVLVVGTWAALATGAAWLVWR